jgi:lysozyme
VATLAEYGEMITLRLAAALIMRHEGFRPQAYRDTRGFLTIGYGTNLDAIGAPRQCKAAGLNYDSLRNGGEITEDEASVLMGNAVQYAIDCAGVAVRGFNAMPDNVQLAIVDMVYNMGLSKFGEFHKLIAALESGNWADAAQEMKDSAWFYQVGNRAKDDITLVETAIGVTA